VTIVSNAQTHTLHTTNLITIIPPNSSLSNTYLLYLLYALTSCPLCTFYLSLKCSVAHPGGLAVYSVGMQPLACWNCRSEFRHGHGCLSYVSVVFCHLGVSASSRSLVHKNPTKCGVSECDFETSTMSFGPLGLSSHGEKKIISGEQHKSELPYLHFFSFAFPLSLVAQNILPSSSFKHPKPTSFTWSKRQSFIPVLAPINVNKELMHSTLSVPYCFLVHSYWNIIQKT
jgi:hypothetical protein